MKRIFLIIIFLAINVNLFSSGKKDSNKKTSSIKTMNSEISYKRKIPESSPIQFKEIWGWVMQERENELDFDYPLTDIGYFAANVDCYGQLEKTPDRTKLAGFPGKVHLVLVCDSKSLTHFVLDPEFNLVDKIIRDIMDASINFDGVQIDYELIPAKDAQNFIYFLEKLSVECKKQKKIFSVCVPARVKTITDDIFPYKKISELCDKVIIMAYDEHWSTSVPGPIASVEWCQKIADYAMTVIPQEKLIMGLPFYGRSWANEKPAQGWYFSGINRIINEYNSGKVEYINDVPTVDINMKVNITCWFEDCYSIFQKLSLYKIKKIENVAFWRIGQEDPLIWNWISIEDTNKNIEEIVSE